MSPAIRRLIYRLTSDKKKLSLMLGLLAVALLLWGRLLLKDVPRTAIAKPNQVAAAEPNTDSAGSSTGFIATAALRQTIDVHLPETVTRDLFVSDRDLYTQVDSGSDVTQTNAKSGSNQTDDESSGRVAGFVLQTTMLGTQPRAMINGEIVLVGQEFRGFTVKQINNRSVILEKNGIETELEM